jgi:hypothetical protein
VFAFAPHGIFAGDAAERVHRSALTEVVVTDSIPLAPAAAKETKIKQITLAPLLAEAIRRVHNNESVSFLFSSPTASHRPPVARAPAAPGAVDVGVPAPSADATLAALQAGEEGDGPDEDGDDVAADAEDSGEH